MSAARCGVVLAGLILVTDPNTQRRHATPRPDPQCSAVVSQGNPLRLSPMPCTGSVCVVNASVWPGGGEGGSR